MGISTFSEVAPNLKVMELTGDFSRRVAAGEIVPNHDPIRYFFDWLFETNSFEYAVLVPKKGFLKKNKRTIWPHVIGDVDEAKAGRDVLEKAAQSGFELIIGTRSNLEDLSNFFHRLGYRDGGNGDKVNAGEHDPARVAWNKDSFVQAVAVATKLCSYPLCIFAHDGDPIYLLYK